MHGTRGKVNGMVVKIDPLRALISASLVILLLAMSGCTSTTGPSALHQQSVINSTSVEKVEVIHFHRNQQCVSCIAIGDLAEKTVNASFRDELASGRLVFAHVNYELPENAALVTKYNVTGPSLWIGVYDADGFHKEQDTAVWYLINNQSAYSTHLSGIITRSLNGDLS
jgi:hypothetical protein